MNKRIRPYVQSFLIAGAVALGSQVFITVGCGGSNDSPMNPTGVAGSGTGAAGTTGVAGTTGSGGTTGAAGTTGMGGSAPFGEPSCSLLRTAAGVEPAKGVACTASDPQFCYRTCGPVRTGIKSETCQTSGTYAEMSGCTFDPSKDYSCYKIPTAAQTACPAGVTPQGAMDCGTVPTCTLCNSLQGVTGGQYFDSTGAPKVGWCVCQEANSAGMRTWSCASDTAWPCPLGAGCS